MKRIGMILDAFYPEDIRITKEATALIEQGFEVFLLCKQRRPDQLLEEKVKGIQVRRIKMGTHLYTTTFWQTLAAATWIHPLYKKALPAFIKDYQLEVLHVHDLPLANTIIRQAKIYQLKVVLDLHENYPAGLQVWSSQKTNPVVLLKNKLFFGYDKWLAYEKDMCNQADYIIAVVEEMKNRLISVHDLPSEKIKTITNTEPTSFVKDKKVYKDVLDRYKGKFVIGYVGGFGPHRGLETVIEAISLIKETIPNVLFMLVGKGSILANLRRMVERLEVTKHVEFVEFQPFEKVYSFMAVADINIIPHYKNEHTDNTIPHKLYQNLMIGKPVVVSSADPLKRVIEEIDGGFVFEAGNAASLVEVIKEIQNNPTLSQQRIENGKYHTLEGQLNWEHTGLKLAEFYSLLTTEVLA